MTLQAPFPWFGGKSRAAGLIWDRLGEVDNYVEPFAGSLAVLLGSPRIARTETVNDKDSLIANFWRAVSAAPDEVAGFADWPVNENDLTARHIWLVQRREELTARLEGDPTYFDAQIAGWWVWGICCWIGSGWCAGNGEWTSVDGKLVHLGNGQGVKRQRVHLGNAGQGVHRKLVNLGNGQGVHRQRVHLGDAGQGVHRQRVHLGDAGQGVHRRLVNLGNGQGVHEWFRALSDRLRRVRVCSGDWTRVLGPTPTTKQGLTGIVLDPPYAGNERCPDVYAVDDGSVSAAVRQWALEHGDDPQMRIALCGYDTEHNMPGWSRVGWKANGGYSSERGVGACNGNKFREVVWFSPHCLCGVQSELFGSDGAR